MSRCIWDANKKDFYIYTVIYPFQCSLFFSYKSRVSSALIFHQSETFYLFVQDSLFLSSLLRNIALGVKFDIDSFPFQHFKIIASFSLGLHCFCWEKLLFISLFLLLWIHLRFSLSLWFHMFSLFISMCSFLYRFLRLAFSICGLMSHQFWKLLAIYLKIFSALFCQLLGFQLHVLENFV